MRQESLRCCLIGETSLLIQCAELLLRRGHAIAAVVSQEVAIRDWARRSEVRFLEPGPQLAPALAEEPFDYLFSTAHLAIIPDEVLALPRRGAINFHDGPLPHYAGLYVTSWALIHRERIHGITWHTMTADVDGGAILKQRRVEVSPDATALSLNAACYEAGIRAFEELVEEIAEDRLRPIEQAPADLQVFRKYQRPEAACCVSFSDPAEDIEALVRALSFGDRYPNPLGLAKLVHEGRVFYLSSVRVLDSCAEGPPGSIVTVRDGRIAVATGTRDLEIAEVLDAAGRRLAGAALLDELGLEPGRCFEEMAPELRFLLTELNSRLCRYERYWQTRLIEAVDLRDPYAAPRPDAAATRRLASAAIDVPPSLDPGVVPAAFALYLARLCESYRFHLAYGSDALREQIAPFRTLFAERVPLEVRLDPGADLASQLEAVQQSLAAADRHLSYARDLLLRHPVLRARGPEAAALRVGIERVRDRDLVAEPPDADLTLVSEGERGLRWLFDTAVYAAEDIARMQLQFRHFLETIAADPGRRLAECAPIDEAERRRALVDWNSKRVDYDRDRCIQHLFEERAARHPDAVAVVFEEQEIRYGELNARANRLAAFLRRLGAGPDRLVGIFMERSIDMMVAILGVLKAGAAYLPLDPGYPAERLEFMLADADVEILVTRSSQVGSLPANRARAVRVDGDWSLIARESGADADAGAGGENLAYAIYTSGSTGRPKGVLVRHRNALACFAAMDREIPCDPPGAWLALTTLSFDISVLELLWTLTRGFRVVLAGEPVSRGPGGPAPAPGRPLEWSLFYFSSDASERRAGGRYDLLLRGAKFGDERGFAAVWTPERHFHAFGGLYPNPSVTSAAIAASTSRIAIRSGSCVLPLHHPLRVAEEWSVVDNLSGGRVGISFAAGWQPNDFVLRPEAFADAKDRMFRDIETVRSLWRGEPLRLTNPKGEEIEVRSLPRPVQAELPVWITAAGNPETFRMAGERGFHVLTHLLGQGFEELAEKIALYREARAGAGHPGPGHVTLMLHTFVGDSDDEVRELVRGPMREYLRSAVGLVQKAAWTFPTQKRKVNGSSEISLSEEDMEALLDHAFERYYETSGLFGTPETCLAIVAAARRIGVDEIGCLIDFGVDPDRVLAHLEHLARLKDLAAPSLAPDDFSIPAQILRHGVTHLQCTPSMAGILLADARTRAALQRVEAFLVGGEALTPGLAARLGEAVGGCVYNVYGPTETTIWSTLARLDPGDARVSIGRPLANEQLYVVDSHLCPVPIGVPGELLIGGDGVTAGYLHRPELTAERFPCLPFAADPSRPVYRTGDRVRYRRDGHLEFLGRVDHQVKIRGHRIEPGEIEAALGSRAGVREAVVVARQDGEAEPRLVAYYVAEPGAVLSVNELRAHLEGTLPEYMIPSLFVPLAELPTTPAGKVDRRALPAPGAERPNLEQSYSAPATDAEKRLAAVCGELLGIGEIGVHDNLFHLGADSILAVHLVVRLRKELGIEIGIGKVFESPTVAALAEYVESLRLLSGDLVAELEDAADEREEIQI